MDIIDFHKKVKTRGDFELFLKMLINDFKINPDEWENDRLDLYLEGIHGYNYDSDNDFTEQSPSRKLFAEILLAARVYE